MRKIEEHYHLIDFAKRAVGTVRVAPGSEASRLPILYTDVRVLNAFFARAYWFKVSLSETQIAFAYIAYLDM